MDKNFTTLRDITRIEDELSAHQAGVLAVLTNEEKMLQVPCTFLYYHKNIYASVQADEDLLEKIVYDSHASFSVVKSEKIHKRKESSAKPYYRIISVTLNGILKRPEDYKITDEIKELYSLKYSGANLNEDDNMPGVFLMLDTVEIKACEEAGG